MKNMAWWTGLVPVAVLGLALAPAGDAAVRAPTEAGEKAVAGQGAAAGQEAVAGKAIFHGKGACFACHGKDAVGTALAPDLTDDAWVNFDTAPTAEQLGKLIKDGVSKPVRFPAPMPPMGGARLNAEEIGQLAAYVLSLSTGG